MIDGVSLLERLHSLGFTHDATLKHITRADFEIEGVPPRLAIGVTTMCKELLCVKRGEKADVIFISGIPCVRPGFSASALREGLGKEVGHLLVKQGVNQDDIAIWLRAGLTTAELLAFGFAPKDVFLAAVDLKLGAKVQLNRKCKYKTLELCLIPSTRVMLFCG